VNEVVERHRKQLAVMRGWLEGKQYFQASDALELVRKVETGTRKDGVTPRFHHQLSVARLVSTLDPHLIFPEQTIAAAFLHDLLEDHGDVWTRENVADRFGEQVTSAVWKLSRKTVGLSKTLDHYFAEIATCPIASVVKLADRAHNLQTMHGVFDPRKQEEYVTEVEEHFYPLIRDSRRAFPRQYGAYENIKILLRCQVRLVRQCLEAQAHGLSDADDHVDALLRAIGHVDPGADPKLIAAAESARQYVEVRNMMRHEPRLYTGPGSRETA
jgi:(p)ppGpp synthase/HD superfamily hydrolase